MQNFNDIVNAAKLKGSRKVVLAGALDESSLLALKEAREEGMASAILVGPKKEVEKKLNSIGFTKGVEEILDFESSADISINAVKVISSGGADILLKGLVHTDTLLKAVLDKEMGLRMGKLLSHVFVVKVPTYPKVLLITDAAMNVAPVLAEKKGILQNCIDFGLKLGIKDLKAAVLAAVEEVSEKMPETMDAAILSKMADRGQIKGALVDGPLAFDNAISKRAAQEKGIKSLVAGDADILLVPHIVVGNVLFKAIAYFIESQIAGIIVGARCPIALASRADSKETKFYSIALGIMAL